VDMHVSHSLVCSPGAPDVSLEGSTGYARARVGLIIPSSNRLTEPQFHRFLPGVVGVHVTRLQMTGKYSKPLQALLEDVRRAACALADAKCDLIVFHCTANSMEHGAEGGRRILDAIHAASGADALSTADAVVEALRACAIEKLVLVTPYEQRANDLEIAYLRALGFAILRDVALAVPPEFGYASVSPARWCEVVRQNLRVEADGYFLSCTNTTQIDAISPLEQELRKPVISSNQATIWASLKRLKARLGPMPAVAELGSLMRR
jgi:maleate cis-trans isomerase